MGLLRATTLQFYYNISTAIFCGAFFYPIYPAAPRFAILFYLCSMLDYLVVGLGLAGIAVCEELEKLGMSFQLITDDSQQASAVAGGLYNPVILKRFTPAWNAAEQMDVAMPFYRQLEKKLDCKLDYKIPVLRRFASVEEQNNWFEAADKPLLKPFLSLTLRSNHNSLIDAPYGYGEVMHTGRVDTALLIERYRQFLLNSERLLQQTFNFPKIEIQSDGVKYESLKAKHIIFTTGFGMKQNPFFDYLPLNGTKGELLTIKSPQLKEQQVIKSSVFIIPLGDNLYRVGATYKWQDKTNIPTAASRGELLSKLDTFLKANYEVMDHVAGVRPTVADRRPLVGKHPELAHLYLLNGLGSRGVLIAPYAARQLIAFIEKGTALHPEMDIARYADKYQGV